MHKLCVFVVCIWHKAGYLIAWLIFSFLIIELILVCFMTMNTLMRLWHLPPSINIFFKCSCTAIQQASCLIFDQTIRLLQYCPYQCLLAAKALTRLHGCADSPEPLLDAGVKSTIISNTSEAVAGVRDALFSFSHLYIFIHWIIDFNSTNNVKVIPNIVTYPHCSWTAFWSAWQVLSSIF